MRFLRFCLRAHTQTHTQKGSGVKCSSRIYIYIYLVQFQRMYFRRFNVQRSVLIRLQKKKRKKKTPLRVPDASCISRVASRRYGERFARSSAKIVDHVVSIVEGFVVTFDEQRKKKKWEEKKTIKTNSNEVSSAVWKQRNAEILGCCQRDVSVGRNLHLFACL